MTTTISPIVTKTVSPEVSETVSSEVTWSISPELTWTTGTQSETRYITSFNIFTNKEEHNTVNKQNDFAFHRVIMYKGDNNLTVHVTLNLEADQEKKAIYKQNRINDVGI